MTRANPALIAAALLLTALATGCSVARQPLPLVEPSYSVRVAEPSMAAAELWPSNQSLRAADTDTAPLASVEEFESVMYGARLSEARLDGISDLMTAK